MKISVIIPVYNVEQYLSRCVNSVLGQTYYDLEIILVDDGSTDESGRICDSFLQVDKRIKVIHQSNCGVSSARNAALDVVEGDCITFIDSDDFVSCDYIESLVTTMERNQADISIVSYAVTSKYDAAVFQKKCNSRTETFTGEEACRRMLLAKGFSCSVSCKLIKKDIIQTRRFSKDMTLGEDLAFYYTPFLAAKNVAFTDTVGYAYFQHSANTINRVDEKNISSLKYMEELIGESSITNIQNAAKSKLISTCFHLLFLADDEATEEILRGYIEKYRRELILSRSVALKVRMACLASFFGFGIFKKLGLLL